MSQRGEGGVRKGAAFFLLPDGVAAMQ